MVAKRSTKMGKIVPYVDVRSPSDIPKFESMVKLGPVFVLVYADWCGHCQRFKDKMWNEVAQSNNRNVNVAAVHYDMVDRTSMKNANIEGYPTLFEVKPTPKANVSTPIPTPQTKEELEALVSSNANMMTNANVNTTLNTNENLRRSQLIINNSTEANVDTFSPDPIESLPPNVEEELVLNEQTNQRTKTVGGGVTKGGSLFETLLKVSADAAHAVVLTGSAMEISRRLKKRKHTRRHHSSKKRQTRRR